MAENKTIGELPREKAEQAIVETALAFHYHNPNCQYNLESTIVADGDKFVRQETTPEMACRETIHYEDCRGFVADVYWNALHMVIPGTRFTWHPILEKQLGREMLVMQFGDESGIKPYRDYEKFVEDFFKMIRPGDILMSDTPSSSHIMLYLGKCMGNGKRYVIHDWPVGGGTTNLETGVNKYEPDGSATLQTVEELWYPGTGKPHWEFGRCCKFWLFRPLNREVCLNAEMPKASLSRLKYPRMVITREANVSIYDTVLAGDMLTVSTTVENKSRKAYEKLVITEFIPDWAVYDRESAFVNGRKGGVQKIVDNRYAIQWTVDVPAGEKVTVSFKTKVSVKAIGKRLVFPEGFVDQIETRKLVFTVGEGKLSKEELKAVTALKKGALPETLTPKTFRDLDYVNLFYKNVLGRKTVLPKTVNELLSKAFYKSRHYGIYDMSRSFPMLDLRDEAEKDEISEEGKAIEKLFIYRFVGGKDVFLEDRDDRAFDFLEEYFTPGDVFVLAGGENHQEITDKAHLAVYVYIGNGLVVSHKKGGTTKEKFEETVGRAIVQNVIIGLRPTNLNS